MNNNIVTTELFTDELFDELAQGGPHLDQLYIEMSEDYDCDFDDVPEWLRSPEAREASIAVREKNTPSTYSKRASMTLYVNDPNEETASGSTRLAIRGPVATGAMAAASKRLAFVYQDEIPTGFTVSTNKETVTLANAGLYRFQIAAKISAFAYIADTPVMPNLLSQPGAVFVPATNAGESAPIDLILEIAYRPTPAASVKTVYRTLASVSFLLSDYANNRVRTLEGALALRLPAGATVTVIFQRRRQQGTVMLAGVPYREALGLVKEPFTIPGSVNPLIDASNYLRIVRLN